MDLHEYLGIFNAILHVYHLGYGEIIKYKYEKVKIIFRVLGKLPIIIYGIFNTVISVSDFYIICNRLGEINIFSLAWLIFKVFIWVSYLMCCIKKSQIHDQLNILIA